MANAKPPTPAELEILHVLSEKGPCTVRQVLEELQGSKSSGYTTVLKLMQIMCEKGLVKRDERMRSHVYSAVHKIEDTQRRLLDDLLNRAFSGSTRDLVIHALEGKKASDEELAEIQKYIRQMKAKKKS